MARCQVAKRWAIGLKVRVFKIGKPSDKTYASLAEKFETRFKSFCKAENIVIKAYEGTERSTKDLLARLNLGGQGKAMDPSHILVSLDERGQNFTSPQVADILRSSIDDGRIKYLDFVIGGPYGLSQHLKSQSHHVWSLSKAVFPSDLAWVMVWEQIYRASTIIRGTSYHHE